MGLDFRDLVSKRVWKMTFFGMKWGQDLENWAADPHQRLPGVPPFQGSGAGRKSCWMIHFGYYSRG